MSDINTIPATTATATPPAVNPNATTPTTGVQAGTANGETDTTTSPATGPSGFDNVLEFFRRGDLGLAIGIVAILVVMILPMPSWLLDMSLALSITFSVMILMTSIFIHRAVEFSAFPTILLIATMMRLALNLASTRLILTDGHEGTDAAGQVIQAFSGFVMSGNFVIGIIVFAILVIVNFVVITKGAGRIAEIAARFTLDGMPGKQMAIDADLSAGLIDESEAKTRRQELEDESTFFGAMDGASKFVRGDAVAGIMITFINVIGGVIIGVAQNDLSFAEASDTYTRLTVGDGLVTQVPALIVSTAAGFLVSKAGVSGETDREIFGQIARYPKGLGMSAVLAGMLSLTPGLPMLPFLALAAITGGFAYKYYRIEQAGPSVDEETEKEEIAATPIEEPISQTLAIDDLRLELGYGLLNLINSERHGHRLTDQIRALRRQIAMDMGFVMPSVRILDNMQLQPNEYVVQVKEVEAGRGQVRSDRLLVMDPQGQAIEIPGEHTTEPTFGLPAVWVEDTLREEASFRGYTVVDPATVVTTHLTEIIKDNMPDLLSYAGTQKLLDELPSEQTKLVEELIPVHLTVTALQRILQRLLSERVSIRDLPSILEGIAEATGYSQSVMMIAEHVRARLARQICSALSDGSGNIPLVTLSPEWEQAFAEALIGQAEEKQLAMAPSALQDFITRVRQVLDELAQQGETPALLTSPGIRPYVRSIIERFRATTPVISQNEIHPQARIRTLSQI